jgi:large subunit ribosomal protein L29
MGIIYHEMTEQELNAGLEESKSELRELRFSYAIAKSLQDPSRVQTLKRNIARILTVKRERELGKAQIKQKTERKAKQKKKEKS